ncbi:MAG: hypothetical protein PHH47_13610 [Gallionella sp.]|nr:hypothetical protein [Gallionella sp.]MDD4947729.1 hypothetical protein [Gallionella sp.]
MAESNKIERMERRQKRLEYRAAEVEKINTDVRERLITLINNQVIYSGRYEYLENRYGIAARKWQNVCNRVQLPGINMLSSILQDYPWFSMWLMLGKSNNGTQLDGTMEGWEEVIYDGLARNKSQPVRTVDAGD